MFGAVAGCTADSSGASDAAATRQAYLRSLAEPTAVDACTEILDASLAAECRVMAASALTRSGHADQALEICLAEPAGPWRDECHFLRCDGLSLRGEDARACCQDAGAWRFQCLGHAINRDVSDAALRHPVGEEPALADEVHAITARYIGGGEAPAKARRLMVTLIAGRAPETRFSRAAHCGNVGGEVCQSAYVERVRLFSKTINAKTATPWRAACAREVAVSRAEGLGMPGWEADVHDEVQAAWRELCQR